MSTVPLKSAPPPDWKSEAGPLRKFLNDITVTEIMINRFDRVFVERKGVIEETDSRFDNPEHLTRFVLAIAVNVGRELNRKNPFLDARLPDGSRVNIVIPPVCLENPMVTIRKFSPMMINYNNLMHQGAFDEKILYFLNQAVVARQNILICGGTGSGKTTILNLLSQFIPTKERVITIEDTVELQMSVKNLVRMECRSFLNDAHLEIKDLLRNALRMRPDRLIIGEVRGSEAFDMLIAMNTGHEGSMSTLHSNSAFDSLRRIEGMVLRGSQDIPISSIREDISKTINIIIQTERYSDGSRRISEIVEVLGRNENEYLIEKIFEFSSVTGFKSLGYIPRFVVNNKNQRIKFNPEFFEPNHKIKLS
ncbi:MAG: CpaF family protein [Deltaproteobacteria bacterium]|jgi:pilus assembly protein CpaF|nr:CpaF family protein [Deltaproteobacteria bacterium]